MRSNKIVYFDLRGRPRFLTECPINSFVELRDLYSIFWELIVEFDPLLEKSFYDLIELNPEILQTALAIVELLGGKEEWIGMETLAGLVYAYADDSPHKGFIWERYFEKKEKPDPGEGVPFDEYRSILLAALAESEGGLKQAQEILDITSEEELSAFFKAKTKLAKDRKKDPDGKQAEIKRLKKVYQEKFGSNG